MASSSRYEVVEQLLNINKGTLVFGTFPTIKATDLQSENDVVISFTDGMRFDTLAYQYYGSGEYWWIICLANNLGTPFGGDLLPGTLIRIPTSLEKVLNFIKIKSLEK